MSACDASIVKPGVFAPREKSKLTRRDKGAKTRGGSGSQTKLTSRSTRNLDAQLFQGLLCFLAQAALHIALAQCSLEFYVRHRAQAVLRITLAQCDFESHVRRRKGGFLCPSADLNCLLGLFCSGSARIQMNESRGRVGVL